MKRPSVAAVFFAVALASCGIGEEATAPQERATHDQPSQGPAGGSLAAPRRVDRPRDEAEQPCSEKPSVPEPLPDGEAGQARLSEFRKLFETGQFNLGYCVAQAQVNEAGIVHSVRLLRPQNADERVAAVVVRTIAARRYKPARACGHPVSFSMTVGINHCPVVSEEHRTSTTDRWVFVNRGSDPPSRALLHYNPLTQDVQIRLDDGHIATLRAEQRACDPADNCEPSDCGCLRDDSYWLTVKDTQGRVVGRVHLWAAYGDLQIIPVDLVDGPGDELLVVRMGARSSPPSGHDLKVLKLAGATPVELLSSHRIAGTLAGTPMACGRWRSRLSVNPEETKPRSIRIHQEVLIPRDCVIDNASDAEAIRKQQPVLTYSDGRYALR